MYFFLSGFSFLNIYNSQDSKGTFGFQAEVANH